MNKTKRNFTAAVDSNGLVTVIYDDALAGLIAKVGAETTRASMVEPAEGGGWTADMAPVGGPILGPFKLRQEALDAEKAWLEVKLFS